MADREDFLKGMKRIVPKTASAPSDARVLGQGHDKDHKGGSSSSTIVAPPTSITPIKIQVGRQNYSKSDDSSAAGLSRQLASAFKDLASDFKWYCDQLDAVMPSVLAAALEPTMELSKVYCPKDTGDLVNSAYLAVEEFRGESRVEIGYARGGSPDYAIYVHEMPYQHEPPTRNKFLQAAIDEDWGGITLRIAQGTKLASGV